MLYIAKNTGYAYGILTYFGSNTAYNPDLLDHGQSEKIFEDLLRPLGRGHHVFADTYYTKHSLLNYLMSKGHFYTGTLQTNHKNFPAEVKTDQRKLAFQESRYFRSESGILLVMWKDKKASKPVVAVSTKDVAGSVVITK